MPIPGRELVGKNARITEGNYSDDYLKALNQFATVDEVFGKHKESIAKAKHNSIEKLVFGTLDKSRDEDQLVAMIIAAAKAGEWMAIPRPEYLKPNIEAVAEKHFGYVTKLENKIFLMPSAMYLAYCKDQQ